MSKVKRIYVDPFGEYVEITYEDGSTVSYADIEDEDCERCEIIIEDDKGVHPSS